MTCRPQARGQCPSCDASPRQEVELIFKSVNGLLIPIVPGSPSAYSFNIEEAE